MKVLMCGDRNWTDRIAIYCAIRSLDSAAVVITGGARGADTIAHEEAVKKGLDTEVFMADWAKHGKAAGPIRNRLMLDQRPELVLAFHDDLSKSKGTRDCVMEAANRGIPVIVFNSTDRMPRDIHGNIIQGTGN